MTDHDAPTTEDLARRAARLAAAIVAVAGVGVAGYGLTWIVEDESTQGEMFDGLGTLVGLVVCGIGVVLLAVAGGAFWLVRRRPLAAAAVLTSLGVLVAAAGVLAIGGIGVAVAAPLVLGGLLVAGVAFGAALAARSVTIDSPGGDAR